MSAVSKTVIEVPDGRVLEVFDAGPPDEPLLIMNHGTPGSGMVYGAWAEVCARHGVRLASYSRPGYGRSTRFANRSVADCAGDVAAVADALGAEQFYVEGHSGGGSHALACSALLSERVLATAVIAGAAPKDAAGFDWWAGNAPENVEEFKAAEAGEQALRKLLEKWREDLLLPDAEDIEGSLKALGSLVSAADRAVVTLEVAAFKAARMRDAIGVRLDGWLDDDLTEMKPWGFDIGSIRTPVSIWYGEEDAFVPRAHAEWLIANVPGASGHILTGEGHWSIKERRLGEIVDELLAAA